MKSRRTFLKILAGIAGAVLPWTILPERLGQGLESWVGKPAVRVAFELPEQTGPKPEPEVLALKAIDDIQALSDPVLEGRRAGTTGETKALVYLEQQVRALKLEPWGTDSYWQIFSIPHMEERIINGRALFRPAQKAGLSLPASNLLAGLAGDNREEFVILSAHYDHLGIYQGHLHPGANDNASGVGCVLQVMRRLVGEAGNGTRPKANIIVALWGAEEMGCLGSRYFVKNPVIPLSDIKALINLDTVGNAEEFILWTNENNGLAETMRMVGKAHKIAVEPASKQGHQSDESAFADTGIPAVTLLSKDWLAGNHTPADDMSIIDENSLEKACQILYDVVKRLAYN